jgi:predicted transcriptional regulator
MPFPILAISGEKQTTDVKAVEAEETQPAVKSYKRIENGKFVIVKDGKQYNSAGQQL